MNRRFFMRAIGAACLLPVVAKANVSSVALLPKKTEIFIEAEDVVSFDEFEKAIIKSVCEGLDIPYSLLAIDYKNHYARMN